MSSRELHGPDCTCSECVLGDNETIVDLTSSVDTDNVYALNEKVEQSCKKLFRPKMKMLDRTEFSESNDDDPEFIIHIPFKSQVKIYSMTMIGGEDGTSPAQVKLYVNQENVDFDLADVKPAQTLNCVENREGELPYILIPAKFNNTWSVTLFVTLNHGGSNTKIYYIGFEGIASHKRKKILVGNYELKPLPDTIKQSSEHNITKEELIG